MSYFLAGAATMLLIISAYFQACYIDSEQCSAAVPDTVDRG